MPAQCPNLQRCPSEHGVLTPRACAVILRNYIAAWYNADYLTVTGGLVSGAEDLTGNGNNGSQATSSNRLTFFPSDRRFGGRASFGSTSSAGGAHLATPSFAITDALFSAYYGSQDTIYSTFQVYSHLLSSATNLKVGGYLLGDSGLTRWYTGSSLCFDASPSINGNAESTTVLPLPPSTLVHSGTNTADVRRIGGDSTYTGRVWVGGIRNVVLANVALTTQMISLIEGVMAWDGVHQHNLINSHQYRFAPPRDNRILTRKRREFLFMAAAGAGTGGGSDLTLAAEFPMLTGALTATHAQSADVAGEFPMLTGALTAEHAHTAELAASFPMLTGDLTLSQGEAQEVALAGELPMLTGALTATHEQSVTVAGELPMLTGAITATHAQEVTLGGSFPMLVGDLYEVPPSESGASGTVMVSARNEIEEQNQVIIAFIAAFVSTSHQEMANA